MLSHTARRVRVPVATRVNPRHAQTFKAFYATIRSLRGAPAPPEPAVEEAVDPADNDFIMSILRANPSLRDTRSYLASFGPRPMKPSTSKAPETAPTTEQKPLLAEATAPDTTTKEQTTNAQTQNQNHVVDFLLDPVYRRTALVKIQGPFTDRQLESIARGMVYLEKLGLVSVIVLENDTLAKGHERERSIIMEETMRVVAALEKQGARARPVLGAVVRLGPHPDDAESEPSECYEAHTFPRDLVHIRSALRAGEIPVLPPMALDSFCRSVRVDADDVIAALTRGMVEAAAKDSQSQSDRDGTPALLPEDVDLTPFRLMIINKEGGVPSYARSGMPHLLVNLASEYHYIRDTYDSAWKKTNPSALKNLALARQCLKYMPPTSSAVMVSHRSPSSLIANLITNKPAVSSSLPHALLQGNRKLEPYTPTLLRRGLDIQVIRSSNDIDKPKMKALLEQSFRRTLDEEAFWPRLDKTLDYVIVAGDYAGAAIVTAEACPEGTSPAIGPVAYLDKFAVLPEHQGDGTVDFLWVALHDESYGLGLPFSANSNGGKEGKGEGRDLVWRSRADNPVNKWYFERSTGHIRMGDWVLFWCDAEVRLKIEEGRRGSAGLSYLEEWEHGRLGVWSDVIMKIPSVWKK